MEQQPEQRAADRFRSHPEDRSVIIGVRGARAL